MKSLGVLVLIPVIGCAAVDAAPKPAIDKNVPKQLKTATFALG